MEANTVFANPISVTSIQNALKEQKQTALLIRSTDRYFNEYVPSHLSIRAKLTGFDGSVGDAIVTTNEAHLFVDGRYTLQAKAQAKGFTVHVCASSQSIENLWLATLPRLLSANDSFAYDPRTVDLNLFEKLSKEIGDIKAKIDPVGENILDQLVVKSQPDLPDRKVSAFKIVDAIAGRSVAQKLRDVAISLDQNKIDALLIVKLDDIAWMTDLRCYYFPFQSSIPAIACVFPDRLYVGVSAGVTIDASLISPDVELITEEALISTIAKRLAGPAKILGVDKSETSKAHELALRQLNIAIKPVQNPVAALKAIKNEKELLHLRGAFRQADAVVYQTQNFVIKSFEQGQTITEADVDRHIREGFKQSGAQELSFRPICASGKNGAVIHYGTPDHQQTIQKNSLFLLDTGGYYNGYATDLTRSFLADSAVATAQPWQKEIFTLVLKASIAGLSARIKRGAEGIQLDAIVRAPLWRAGFDFAHGTGHGLGINVHEFPPRIGPGSRTPLMEGHVFSIEPGLYFENRGGVRIENLATLVADPDLPDFLRVLPLTFCPLDERLINHQMLDDFEKEFLDYFAREWTNNEPWPNLPPLAHKN